MLQSHKIMVLFTVGLSAFFAALLTFFSGFGLGTLLMPVLALFVPIPVSVAITAVVHLCNDLFKTTLLGRHAHRKIVLVFGLFAIPGSLAGAKLLFALSRISLAYPYPLFGRTLETTPIKMLIAGIIIAFVLIEWLPSLKKISFDKRLLPLGGLLSGFFGGLSGHQGALRIAFLIRCELSKEQLLGTSAVIACLIDLARVGTYSTHQSFFYGSQNISFLIATVLSALLGSWVGNHFLKKWSLNAVHSLVSMFLIGIALALGTGIL